MIEKGLQAAEELRILVPQGFTMAQFVLKWILIVPRGEHSQFRGLRIPARQRRTLKPLTCPPLREEVLESIREVSKKYILPDVHHRW